MDGIGVDEGDLEAEQPRARLGVDQLRARFRERRERLTDVADLVRDVVHARPAAREELADRCVLAGCGKQLDASGADEHSGRVHALLIHPGTVFQLGAEQSAVGLDRLVEVVDGDAEMMNATGSTRGDANRGAAGRAQSASGTTWAPCSPPVTTPTSSVDRDSTGTSANSA